MKDKLEITPLGEVIRASLFDEIKIDVQEIKRIYEQRKKILEEILEEIIKECFIVDAKYKIKKEGEKLRWFLKILPKIFPEYRQVVKNEFPNTYLNRNNEALFQEDTPLDMEIYINKKQKIIAVKRIKTFESFLEKIIFKKIFGQTKKGKEKIQLIKKYGLSIIKKSKDTKNIANFLKKELIWREKILDEEEKINYGYYFWKPVIVTPESLKEEVEQIITKSEKGDIFDLLFYSEFDQEIINNFFDNKLEKILRGECYFTKDLGGICFINPDGKGYADKVVIDKIKDKALREEGRDIEVIYTRDFSKDKRKGSDYVSYHVVIEYPNIPDLIELQFVTINWYISNHWGRGHHATFKRKSREEKSRILEREWPEFYRRVSKKFPFLIK